MEDTPSNLNPELEDTSFILNSLANEVQLMVRSIQETFDQYEAPRHGEIVSKEFILIEGASRYALIKVCSFLEEWDNQLGELKRLGIENQKLMDVKFIAKPAYKGIKEFSGLEEYRDKFLAHNSRIKSKGSVNAYRGNYLSRLTIPHTIYDYWYIANCVSICRDVFNEYFPEYVRDTYDFTGEHTLEFRPSGMNGEKMSKKLNEITAEVERLYESKRGTP